MPRRARHAMRQWTEHTHNHKPKFSRQRRRGAAAWATRAAQHQAQGQGHQSIRARALHCMERDPPSRVD
eukprot:4981033-Prymnesium_polylepis.1